jgi:hypothetical protein
MSSEKSMGTGELALLMVEIADKEVGTEEVDGTNCGPRVNQYKAATNLPPDESWPWCAAFIDWLVLVAMKKTGKRYTFKRPTTAGAWDLENWSRAQDESTWTKKPHRGDIREGDIVVFVFSHVGLAISTPDKNGYILTVEGNTDDQGSREGGGVFRKRRHVSMIRSRLRIMV